MAKEIERKYLVTQPEILAGLEGERIVQGYVAKEIDGMKTRIRIRARQAFITLKGPSIGFSRDEYEYEIPLEDAVEILERYAQGRMVCKTRYLLVHDRMTYEIDVFSGRHAGLVVAELELSDEVQPICLPEWIGAEVTDDPRYGNFSLAMQDASPVSKWWIGEFADQPAAESCCCGFSGYFSCCHMKNEQMPGDR